MTKLKQILLVAGCAAALSFTTGKVAAQGRGNFDPAQIKQNIVDSYKDRMNVTNDDEWKVLQVAIAKVVDAGADVRAGTIRSFGGFGGNRRNRGGNSTDTANANPPRQRGGPGGFGQPSAEADDLQKAIEAKAPKDEIASKLAKLREANAANEAKLVAAQDDLKKLLTPRQEAVAVVYGLLK